MSRPAKPEDDKKRKIESQHFKLFRAGVPDFPEGEVWHEDRPDFWIFADGETLGVEHSELVVPASEGEPELRAIEETRRGVAELAQEHSELRGLPPMFVSVIFAHGQGPIQKSRRLALARRIANICAERLPSLGQSVAVELDYKDLEYLPTEVQSLWISRQSDQRRHQEWDFIDPGLVHEDTRQLIQNRISAKAPRISEYLQHCARCWLFLVAHAYQPSGFIEPSDETLDHVYESPFERTYFLNAFQRRPVPLRTRAPVGSGNPHDGPTERAKR